jgi:hypothetical protein
LSTARLPVLLALILATASPAWALDSERLNRELLKLDPVTRLEQACDTEVMLRINKENRDYSVDKVIAYTFTNPGTTSPSTARPKPNTSTRKSFPTRSAPPFRARTGNNITSTIEGGDTKRSARAGIITFTENRKGGFLPSRV